MWGLREGVTGSGGGVGAGVVGVEVEGGGGTRMAGGLEMGVGGRGRGSGIGRGHSGEGREGVKPIVADRSEPGEKSLYPTPLLLLLLSLSLMLLLRCAHVTLGPVAAVAGSVDGSHFFVNSLLNIFVVSLVDRVVLCRPLVC